MRQARPDGWRYAQYVVSALCMGSALLLIELSLNGRTVWTEDASSGARAVIRDAAGWDWLARGAGVVAIIALGFGLYARRRWPVVVCPAAASVCLAWAADVAWRYNQDISQGLVVRQGYTVRTPEQIGLASQVAAFASALTLLLLLVSIGYTSQKGRPASSPLSATPLAYRLEREGGRAPQNNGETPQVLRGPWAGD